MTAVKGIANVILLIVIIAFVTINVCIMTWYLLWRYYYGTEFPLNYYNMFSKRKNWAFIVFTVMSHSYYSTRYYLLFCMTYLPTYYPCHGINICIHILYCTKDLLSSSRSLRYVKEGMNCREGWTGQAGNNGVNS